MSQEQYQIPKTKEELGGQREEYPEAIPPEYKQRKTGEVKDKNGWPLWAKRTVAGAALGLTILGGAAAIKTFGSDNAEAQTTTTTEATEDPEQEFGPPESTEEHEGEPTISVPELTGDELVEAMQLEVGLTGEEFQTKAIESVETWVNSGSVSAYDEAYSNYEGNNIWQCMEDIAKQEAQEILLPTLMGTTNTYEGTMSEAYIESLIDMKSEAMAKKVLEFRNEAEVTYQVNLDIDEFKTLSGAGPTHAVTYTAHVKNKDSAILQDYEEKIDGVQYTVAFSERNGDKNGEYTIDDDEAVATYVNSFVTP